MIPSTSQGPLSDTCPASLAPSSLRGLAPLGDCGIAPVSISLTMPNGPTSARLTFTQRRVLPLLWLVVSVLALLGSLKIAAAFRAAAPPSTTSALACGG